VKEIEMKKQSKAKQILAYATKNPSASLKDIAKATRSTYGYVYKVVNRKVATPQPAAPKKQKSTDSPLDRALRLVSDGSTADYYELPKNANELQDLISHKNMNAQIGEIFRACYRYGEVAHSKMLRDAKKIKYYAEAEIKRLENLSG
jgi:Flp pilus assembly CpaF family ATPase